MATMGLRSMETSHKTVVILRCKLILVGRNLNEIDSAVVIVPILSSNVLQVMRVLVKQL